MSKAVRRLVHDMRSRERAALSSAYPQHGADTRTMRAFNRLLVLNCIRQQGPLARVTVARRTGLSRTTVSSIVDALLQEGLVRDGATLSATSAGGRRATLVHFREDAGSIVGIDMGRTHLTMLLTDLAAHVHFRASYSFDAMRGAQTCLPEVVSLVRAFVAESGVRWESIVGLGMGLPSPVDDQRQVLVAPPRMPGWDGVSIGEYLRHELHIPVYLDNDANLGALGECRFGAGKDVANVAYINIGGGVGGGLVLNGTIYRGSSGSAGEFGHVAIEADGPQCDCGNRGCLETLAGGRAIVAYARRGLAASPPSTAGTPGAAGPREPADTLLSAAPTAPAAPTASAVTTADIATVADVVRAAAQGNAACRAALERAGEYLGVAVANLINFFNPSLILLDGSVTRAGEALLAPLRRTAASRSLALAWARTRILPGELGENAIALGAVSMVLDAAFDTPVATALPTAIRDTSLTINASPPLPIEAYEGAGG